MAIEIIKWSIAGLVATICFFAVVGKLFQVFGATLQFISEWRKLKK